MPRFLEALPSDVEPWLRARLERNEPFSEEERTRPCFAGVDLSLGDAYALLERLKHAGAHGYLVPARYWPPRLSLEETRRLAEQALGERISRHRTLRAFRFEPVRHNPAFSTPMFQVFEAFSPDMDEHGYIPASVSVQVDTADGHLWAHEEFSLLRQKLEAEGRQVLGLPRADSSADLSRRERRKHRGKLKRLKD